MMNVRTGWYSTLLVFALASMPALAGKPAVAVAVSDPLTAVKTLQVEGWVVIDTQGRVEDYRLKSKINEPLRSTVDKAVRAWSFHPVLVDGQVRRAEALMRVTLAATQVGEGYEVRVDNVIFPNPELEPSSKQSKQEPKVVRGRRLKPPSYPPGLAMANVSGVVLLAIRVGEDGRVADVAPVQTMLLDIRGQQKTLQLAAGMFEAASLDAARRWTFWVPADFSQWPADKRIVTVPVEYQMTGSPTFERTGVWRTVVRTPKRRFDWMPLRPGSQSVGVADVGRGEFVPVASALSLKSDVVGAAL